MIRIERRLTESRWLVAAVPAGSLVAAAILSGLILLVTGHDPVATWSRLLDRGFFAPGAMGATLVTIQTGPADPTSIVRRNSIRRTVPASTIGE